MTPEECADVLEQLGLSMRQQVDVPTILAYHAMLKDVPVELVIAGLDQWRQTGPRFFPSAPEIQSFAEKARRQLLALHPWTPCLECEDQPGWRTITEDGVKRLDRCPCKARHKELLASRGLVDPIAMLPGESGGIESEQVYPTMAQLPEPLQAQLKAITGQKVMR